MAIEAARQLVSNDDQVSSYRLKDVFFPKTISLDNPDSMAEISIVLRPQAGATNLVRRRFEFQIFHLRNEESVEVCRGNFHAESRSEDVPPVARLTAGDSSWSTQWREKHGSIATRCDQQVHHDQFYENMYDMGFQYSPTFQRLRFLKFNM